MTQVTVGLQLGAQGYSEMVFFEDERAFKEFTSDNFEFSADANAIAITAAAGAKATTVGKYPKGMATFTIAKGGLMYEASVGGQKFSYKAK